MLMMPLLGRGVRSVRVRYRSTEISTTNSVEAERKGMFDRFGFAGWGKVFGHSNEGIGIRGLLGIPYVDGWIESIA